MSCMYRALCVTAAAILGACAERPAPPIRYTPDSASLALMDAQAIEAAKRHPNAQPRVRPEYPEQAPPPLPAGQILPAPLYITRRAEPYAEPNNVVVERTVYADNPYRYRYGYGYGYRRPYGYGLGWDPYGYGYYYPPRSRYGYGFSLGASYWRSPHFHHAHVPARLHWDAPRLHWGFSGSHHHGGGHGGRSFNVRSFSSGHRHRH